MEQNYLGLEIFLLLFGTFLFLLEFPLIILKIIRLQKLLFWKPTFNLFGKNSLLNLFDWYTQDEFVGSFSVSKTDNKWNFTFYNGINLYSSNNNIIQNNLEIKLNMEKDFSLFENIAWSRSGKTTLLVSIIKLFDNDFIPAKIVRFNSFGLSFVKNLQDFSFNQTYDANHKVQVFINEIASVNTNFSFLYNIKDQSQKIELSLTISGKLSF